MEELETANPELLPPIEPISGEVPSIYSKSARSESEFPELPEYYKQSVCVARMMVDPLTEYAALCSGGGGVDDELVCFQNSWGHKANNPFLKLDCFL